MFLDPLLVLDSNTTQRYEYIEASTPEEMSRRFDALVSRIVAENAARVSSQLEPFNVYDMDIAGGGDGHTFIVKLLLSTFVPDGTLLGWIASSLGGGGDVLEATFWLAGTEQELAIAASAALAELMSGAEDVLQVNVGMAGAAKGTRFMGFLAGIVEPLTPR